MAVQYGGITNYGRQAIVFVMLAVVVFSIETNNPAFNYIAVFMGLISVLAWYVLWNRPSTRNKELIIASIFPAALSAATLAPKKILTLPGLETTREVVGMMAAMFFIAEIILIVWYIGKKEVKDIKDTLPLQSLSAKKTPLGVVNT